MTISRYVPYRRGGKAVPSGGAVWLVDQDFRRGRTAHAPQIMLMAQEAEGENRESKRGAVAVAVPRHFTDLSTVHHSLGSLAPTVGVIYLPTYS